MAYRYIKTTVCTALISAVSFVFTPLAQTASLAELAVGAKYFKTDALFGYNEFPSSNFAALPQWQRILDYFKQHDTSFDECLKNAENCSSANEKSIAQLIHSAENLSAPEKLRTVNEFFNKLPYKTDRENYLLPEYWATPDEFMTRSGDCEDYAIAKYFVLRRLGFSADKLRIVTVFDSIRVTGHAVLAVYLTEKNIIILDSLSNGLFEHTLYRHYIPQYSVNETTRWLHTAPTPPEPKPVTPAVKDYTPKPKYFTINPIEGFEYHDRNN